MGKDPRWLFKKMDGDGNGVLDVEEVLFGIKNTLGVLFTRDETDDLMKWLDKDGSGDVDEDEFCSKISLKNVH
jgi:Ca2+-binding EF-hand superfamily protein